MENSNVQPSTYQPNPPTIPSQKPNANFWKYIGIGMSIVSFCLAIAFIGYVYVLNKNQSSQISAPKISATPTPTPDPTAGWKTYTDTQYGYSFKYPPEWNYKIDQYGLLFFKTIRSPQPTGAFESLPEETSARITYSKKETGVTLDSWAQIEAKKRGITDFKPIVTKIKLTGINAIETEFPSRFGEHVTVLMNATTVITLTLEWITEEDEIAQKEFKNQILSTFKFTN